MKMCCVGLHTPQHRQDSSVFANKSQNIPTQRQTIATHRQNIPTCRQNIPTCRQNIPTCRQNIQTCRQNILICRHNVAVSLRQPHSGAQRECGQCWEEGRKERGLWRSAMACQINWQLEREHPPHTAHSGEDTEPTGEMISYLISLGATAGPTFGAEV